MKNAAALKAHGRRSYSSLKTPVLLIGALVLVVVGLLNHAQDFYGAYLFSFVFWLGLSLGAMAILLLGECTGGRWFIVLKPQLNLALKPLALLGFLFVPILFKLDQVYPWVALTLQAGGSRKLAYLKPVFFILRSIFYFLVWGLLGWRLRLSFDRQTKFQMAPGALIVLVLTMTFASIDWIMSLQTEFYSTLFGLLFLMTCALGAMALAIIRATAAQKRATVADSSASHSHAVSGQPINGDLGNLLLAFTMTWTYLSFMQFLIVWMGNLPEESNWYIRRLDGGWQYLAYALITFQFFLPFFLMLFKPIKRSPVLLGRVAKLALVMQVVYSYWVILPLFHHESLGPTLADTAVFVVMALLWRGRCEVKW